MDILTSNTSSNAMLKDAYRSQLSLGLLVAYLLLFIPSAIFNVILIVTVVTHRLLRTPTSVFMCSLAVSDLMYAVVVNIFAGIGVVDVSSLYGNSAMARTLEASWWFAIVAHYNFFVAMSVERWLYIARPFLHQRFVGRKFITASMAVIWIVSVLSTAPHVIVVAYVDMCLTYVLPYAHILSCVIVASVYVHIVVITRRQIKAIVATAPQGTVKDNSLTSRLRHWKAVRLLLVVFGIFVVTLTPYVCYTSLSLNRYITSSGKIGDWLLFLGSLHYTSNFPVYIFLHRKFRNVVRARAFCLVGFFKSNNRIHHHMTANSYS